MIHEENKNQQPEKEDFFLENFLDGEKKQPFTEQQVVTHREDFAKPEVDEEAIMRVMAGEEPSETETQHTKIPASNTKKMIYKPKKLTKEDYYGQFFKIPN